MILEEDFEKILDEVILENDKVVVLYSGIWTFIYNINFRLKNKSLIPHKILDIIEKKIGKNKTLFLPSFSGGFFSKNRTFNITKGIDKDNGILPIIGLERKYFRTLQPIHSYIAFGNLKDVKKLKLKSSWGKNSLLEFFSKKNARICTLGLPWYQGCAYLHRFEELYKVSWRYNKKFTANIINNGKKFGKCHEIKYCSSKLKPLNYSFRPFVKHIEKAKSFKKSKNKLIKFESIKASCLNKIGKNVFSKNPWIIVKNIKTTKKWIKTEKSKELNFIY